MADETGVESPDIKDDGVSTSDDDAGLDAVLDDMFNSGSPSGTRAAESGAKETPADDTADSDAEDEPADRQTDDSAESETPEGVEPDDWERAMSALSRSGIDARVLRDWARTDPQGMLRRGLAQAEHQARMDAQRTELAETRRKLEELEARAPRQSGEDEDLKLPDLALDDHLKALTEAYGEEMAGPLKGVVEAVRKDTITIMAQVMQDQLARRDQALASIGQHLGQILKESERSRLAAEYPQVSDDGVWQKVVDRVKKDGASGRFDNLRAAFDEAALLVLGREALAQRNDKTARERKARAQGQMTTPSRTQAGRPAAKSAEDLEDAVLDAMFSGKSREQIAATIA